ncbi:hypothetical protein PoB_000009300 [Plakobranchus ocellatus]|uniref:Secreted protein n=1 Tax=Plakobranchus ocellatus TaxID=259542 RepID=A0AAV3XST1_9GAST|nr:hypothetical protein PoB_000009300 [Plakobranchus ocellatus]
MWKLVALLASLLFVTEVTGDCRSLALCDSYVGQGALSLVDRYVDKSMIMSYFLGSEISSICNVVPLFISCVDENLGHCEDEEAQDRYETRLNLLQYLCSPIGRGLAFYLCQSAYCRHVEWFKANLLPKLNRCYEVFTDGKSSDCSHVEKLRQCLVNSAPETVCHDPLVRYIKGVWSHAAGKEYEHRGCPTQ